MGRHSEDHQKNLKAAAAVRNGNRQEAVKILRSTSQQNQLDFWRRMQRAREIMKND
jgi:ribosomal protein L22